MKVLFKNARLLPEDMPVGTRAEDYVHVVVTDEYITYIGATVPEDTYDRVIDCKENLLMPAFYNAHCHAAMTLFRGYGEDLPLQRWLEEKIFPAEELLTGILHNRLGRVIVKEAGLKANTSIFHLYDSQLEEVISLAKDFRVNLTEPLGMDAAQVTAGGIVTSEFDPQTMESRLVPGLYACGEVLDVDGDCGGYNLQWAWSSGAMAGGMHR